MDPTRSRDYGPYLAFGTSPGGGRSLNVTFYGVRGSTPCSCEENRRYGGNTACVALDIPGSRADRPRPRHRPALLGRRTCPRTAAVPRPRPRHAPALGPRAGPARSSPRCRGRARASTSTARRGRRARLGRRLRRVHAPAVLPGLRWRDLPGDIGVPRARRRRLHHRRRQVPRPAGAPHRAHQRLPHRARRRDASPTSPTTSSPIDGCVRDRPTRCSSCADGADLLIHDAQFTPREFAMQVPLGPLHRRVRRCASPPRPGVRRLALFHHDPSHDDVMRRLPPGRGPSQRAGRRDRRGHRRRRGPTIASPVGHVAVCASVALRLRSAVAGGQRGGHCHRRRRHRRAQEPSVTDIISDESSFDSRQVPPGARPLPDGRHGHHRR